MEVQLLEALKQAEKEFNKVYSGTYSHIYTKVKSYVKTEEEMVGTMQSLYVEAYKRMAEGAKYDNIITWLEEILKHIACSGQNTNETPQEVKTIVDTTTKTSAETVEESEAELAEEIAMEKAQEIYNACCRIVGLTPTVIMSEEEKNKNSTGKKLTTKSVKEKVKNTAKKVVKDEIEGAVKDGVKKGIKTVVKEAVKGGTAEEAGQAVGLIAKLAALSTKMKVMVMAGTLAASVVTVGVVGTVTRNNHDEMTDTSVSREHENVLDNYNASDYLGLYYGEGEVDYSGLPLLRPTKTSANTYVFYAKDIEEYFLDGDYAALVVLDNMPEELAVACCFYAVAPGDYIPAWSDEKIMYVPITKNCDIIVTISLKEDATKIRSNL